MRGDTTTISKPTRAEERIYRAYPAPGHVLRPIGHAHKKASGAMQRSNNNKKQQPTHHPDKLQGIHRDSEATCHLTAKIPQDRAAGEPHLQHREAGRPDLNTHAHSRSGSCVPPQPPAEARGGARGRGGESHA